MVKTCCLALIALLVAGAALAATPEIQGPMSPVAASDGTQAGATPPAAEPQKPGAPPARPEVKPDPVFLDLINCTFQYNDCFVCARSTIRNCDVYRCYDTSTGQYVDQLRNCTPCGRYC